MTANHKVNAPVEIVEGFKQGSQKREETTVAGATAIKTNVQLVTSVGARGC